MENQNLNMYNPNIFAKNVLQRIKKSANLEQRLTDFHILLF